MHVLICKLSIHNLTPWFSLFADEIGLVGSSGASWLLSMASGFNGNIPDFLKASLMA